MVSYLSDYKFKKVRLDGRCIAATSTDQTARPHLRHTTEVGVGSGNVEMSPSPILPKSAPESAWAFYALNRLQLPAYFITMSANCSAGRTGGMRVNTFPSASSRKIWLLWA